MKKLKILPFAVSIVIIVAIIYLSNPYQIYLSITKVNKVFISIAVGFSLLNILLRVLKWKVILKGVGVSELFPIQMLGMSLSSLTPGKVAEPAKSVLLKMKKNIPVSVSLPTVVWERINDVVAIILLSFVVIQTLSIRSNILLASILSIAAFLILVAVLIVALYNRGFGNRVFRLIKKLPGTGSISGNFIDNFYSVKTEKKRIITSFAITCVTWVVEGVIFYFVLLSMGINSNFMVLAGIVSLAAIIGIATFLPGGIGSLEFVMVFLVGLTGVENAMAVSAVFIYRIVAFWFSISIGGLSFAYLSKKIDMKNLKFE